MSKYKYISRSGLRRKIHDAAFVAPLRPLREMYLLNSEPNDEECDATKLIVVIQLGS